MLIILAVSIWSCGKDDKDKKSGGSFDSGIPAITPIIASTLPATFKEGSLVLLKTFNGCGAIATPEDAVECLKSQVFNKPTTGSDNTFYLKWVSQLDERIAEMEKRFSEIPPCFKATAVTFQADFALNTAVSETFKLQCWESLTSPPGVEAQKMAVGVDAQGNFNLVLVTKFTSNSGIVLLGKAKANGKSADVWVLNTSATDTNVTRVIADKDSNSFVFNFAATDSNGNRFCDIFAHSNGTDIFMAATPGGVSCGSAVAFANSGCLSASDITQNGTDCSAINTFPAEFTPAEVTLTSHVSATTTTNAMSIINTDFAALNIGELKANTPDEEGDGDDKK